MFLCHQNFSSFEDPKVQRKKTQGLFDIRQMSIGSIVKDSIGIFKSLQYLLKKWKAKKLELVQG